MTSTLCRSFHRLKLSIGLISKSKYSTLHQSGPGSQLSYRIPVIDPKLCQSMTFSPALTSLDLNIRHPGLRNQIIDSPVLDHRNEVTNPQKIINQIQEKESPALELPPLNESLNTEKQAARLIVIRRHKMKKHRKKKLKKKMKFLWRKHKFRRAMRKEKKFHAELLAQIRKAEEFDPEQYVKSRLDILDYERVPAKWQGEYLPEDVIRQLIKEKKEKSYKNKVANRPRLTLD